MGREGRSRGRDTVECNSVTNQDLLGCRRHRTRHASPQAMFTKCYIFTAQHFHRQRTKRSRHNGLLDVVHPRERDMIPGQGRAVGHLYCPSHYLCGILLLFACENFANSISAKEHNIPDSDWVDSSGDDDGWLHLNYNPNHLNSRGGARSRKMKKKKTNETNSCCMEKHNRIQVYILPRDDHDHIDHHQLHCPWGGISTE